MIIFAQPIYLLLLIAIPLFYLFYALHRRGRNKRIARFGDPELVDKLMPERSKSRGWVKLTCFSLAWFFLVIGLARPQIGAKLKESDNAGSEIMIALDVSNSMRARDYSPCRLDRAKMDISRLVDRLRNDRIGLVVFAGESFVQLPITADYVSAKVFLNGISTNSVSIQGTAIGDAIMTCASSFSEEGMAGTNNKAIILISDGENHEDDAVEAAREAAAAGINVYTIGVGTPQGEPIPDEGGWLMKDREGNTVVTKLDEEALRQIAEAGNGIYVKASDSDFGLGRIIEQVRDLEKTQYKSVTFEEFNEQFMYFLGIALFFLLLEFIIGNRKLSKKLFMVAAMLLLVCGQSYAQSDRKDVRRGNKYFKGAHYKQAEVEYRKGLLKDSLSVLGRYNLGNTLYKMEDDDAAIKLFEGLNDSVAKIPFTPNPKGTVTEPKLLKLINDPSKVLEDEDVKIVDPNDPQGGINKERAEKLYKEFETHQGKQSIASKFFFNAGNVYLSKKQYDKALEAYKQSLLRNPADMTAKANYAYAKKLLEDQQNQNQQNQDQNQNQDQQDQNQNQNQNQDQDKNQNQDQNQDQNQQNQDQNKDQNQDQKNNPDNGNDKQDQKNQNGGAQPKVSPQAAQQILQAIQDKENSTQEKVKKAKAAAAKSRQKEKNW